MWNKASCDALANGIPLDVDVVWDKRPSAEKYGRVCTLLAILAAIHDEGVTFVDSHQNELTSLTVEPIRRKLADKTMLRFRYHPAEANLYVPVSLNMFAIMQNSFLNAFGSQKAASFPSYEHDGPFSELAQQVRVQQYQTLKTCLGREFFYKHPSPLIRATRGIVFLKRMELAEFDSYARELRKTTEDL